MSALESLFGRLAASDESVRSVGIDSRTRGRGAGRASQSLDFQAALDAETESLRANSDAAGAHVSGALEVETSESGAGAGGLDGRKPASGENAAPPVGSDSSAEASSEQPEKEPEAAHGNGNGNESLSALSLSSQNLDAPPTLPPRPTVLETQASTSTPSSAPPAPASTLPDEHSTDPPTATGTRPDRDGASPESRVARSRDASRSVFSRAERAGTFGVVERVAEAEEGGPRMARRTPMALERRPDSVDSGVLAASTDAVSGALLERVPPADAPLSTVQHAENATGVQGSVASNIINRARMGTDGAARSSVPVGASNLGREALDAFDALAPETSAQTEAGREGATLLSSSMGEGAGGPVDRVETLGSPLSGRRVVAETLQPVTGSSRPTDLGRHSRDDAPGRAIPSEVKPRADVDARAVTRLDGQARSNALGTTIGDRAEVVAYTRLGESTHSSPTAERVQFQEGDAAASRAPRVGAHPPAALQRTPSTQAEAAVANGNPNRSEYALRSPSVERSAQAGQQSAESRDGSNAPAGPSRAGSERERGAERATAAPLEPRGPLRTTAQAPSASRAEPPDGRAQELQTRHDSSPKQRPSSSSQPTQPVPRGTSQSAPSVRPPSLETSAMPAPPVSDDTERTNEAHRASSAKRPSMQHSETNPSRSVASSAESGARRIHDEAPRASRQAGRDVAAATESQRMPAVQGARGESMMATATHVSEAVPGESSPSPAAPGRDPLSNPQPNPSAGRFTHAPSTGSRHAGSNEAPGRFASGTLRRLPSAGHRLVLRVPGAAIGTEEARSGGHDVRVMLRVQGGDVQARFLADRSDVEARLRDGLPELRSSLQRHGLQTSGLDVVAPVDGDGRGRRDREGQPHQRRQRRANANQDTVEPTGAEFPLVHAAALGTARSERGAQGS